MLVLLSQDSHKEVLRVLAPVFQRNPGSVFRVVKSLSEILPLMAEAKAILSMGSQSLETFQEVGSAPKNRKVTGLRKTVFQWNNIPVMATYSVGIAAIDYGQYVNMLTDAGMAMRLADTGSLAPKYGDYQYVSDLSQYADEVRQLIAHNGSTDQGFDTETLGLDRFHRDGYLISLQFSHTPGMSRVVAFPNKAASLQWLLDFKNQTDLGFLLGDRRIRTCAANGKYDLEWLYEQAGIQCSNFTFDTTMVGSLLDENRSNGLDVHAKVYLPNTLGGYSDEFDLKADKSRMDLEMAKDPAAFLLYSGGDSDATLQVKAAQKDDLLQDEQLTSFYVNIMHPALRAFEHVERTGVLLDLPAYDELEADLRTEMVKLIQEGKKHLGGLLVAKHGDPDKPGGLNLVKPSLLIDFLFSPSGMNLTPKMMTAGGEKKGPQASTAGEHLIQFISHPEAGPFIKLLSDFSSAQKMLSTYVTGFKKHIRSDGRYHPTYYLFAGNKDDGDGGTNCMPVGELVLTNRGYLPVELVRVGDFVISHLGRPQKVLTTVNNGIKPVVKVQLSNGLVLRTTENHQYLVGGGWVEAGALKAGDQCWAHSDPEEWLPVRGWPYQVSSWGRVRGASGCVLAQQPKGKWGHLKVALKRNGSSVRGQDFKDFSVHRLVAQEFHEELGAPEIRHLNGLAWDNTKGNLDFGTSQNNRDDAVRHGTMSRRRGSQNVLTDETAEYLRGLPPATRGSEFTNARLAVRFGVCSRLIRAVRNGQRWAPEQREGKRVQFKPVAVVSTELQAGELTYGLTVATDCSHVTGGVVTHNTGRPSVRDPAFQTIPKYNKWAKAIRRCYPAPPGYLVLETDYSQGELRVVACVAGEQTMLDSYSQGLDLHVVTGGRIGGYTYEEMMAFKKAEKGSAEKKLFEDLRQQAKAGNFGLLYGMGVEGFMAYAYTNYGVVLTYAQAEEIRNNFFNTYPGLVTYHTTYKAFAKRHGYVRSPLGRLRHLPLVASHRRDIASGAERQAINSPIQGALSDLMLWAVSEQHRMDWHHQTPCFGTVHDAGYYYIPEDNAEFFARRTVEVMENLPFEKVGWKPQLKFVADAKIGRNMADLQEVAWSK